MAKKPQTSPLVSFFRQFVGKKAPDLTAAVEELSQLDESLTDHGKQLKAEIGHARRASGDRQRTK
jgi:hypothetical protein